MLRVVQSVDLLLSQLTTDESKDHDARQLFARDAACDGTPVREVMFCESDEMRLLEALSATSPLNQVPLREVSLLPLILRLVNAGVQVALKEVS